MASKAFTTIFLFDGTPAEVLVLLEDISAGLVQVTLEVDPAYAIGDIAGFFTTLDGITVQDDFSISAVAAEPGDALTVGSVPTINTLFLDDSGSTTDAVTDIVAEINSMMGVPLPSYDLGVQIGTASFHPEDDYQRVVFQLAGPAEFDSRDVETVGVSLKGVSDAKGNRTQSQFLQGTAQWDGAGAIARLTPPQPSLSVTKQADVAAIAHVGDIISYTIDVENTGDIALTQVSVTDPLIPDLVLASGDVDSDGELDVDETWRYTGTLTVTQDLFNESIAGALDESVVAASSDAFFEFFNFSHPPEATRVLTDTDTVTVAEDLGTAVAIADANAVFTTASAEDQAAPPASETSDNPIGQSTTGANLISNETTVFGLSAFGQAQSEASVLGEFAIQAGDTFSFEFEGALNVQADVGNPVFGGADASGLVFFDVLDDPSLEADPIDSLAIAGLVTNAASNQDDDFLELIASDTITLDEDNTQVQTDFDGAEQSAEARVKGTYSKTFDADTVVTLIEAKVGTAFAEVDLQGGLPIVNTVTVDTAQTDPVTARASVDIDIPPVIDVAIQKQVNGVDADTPTDAVKLAPGAAIAWTYNVTNLGNVSLENLTVVDDNGTPEDDSDDITPEFIGGDINQNHRLDPDEIWIYGATGTAQDLAVTIDFDTDGNGSPLAAGEVITDQYANLGLTVSTPLNAYGAMLFDSSNPTGGDTDLGTPTHPAGPGIGRDAGAGIGNLTPLGHVLIISEDGDASDPDDNATGGTLRFDLNGSAHFVGVNLLDIDLKERHVTAQTFEGDQLIQSVAAANLGDNSFQRVDLGGVVGDRLEVNLIHSGAVTGLDVVNILPSTSTISASVADVTVTATDTSYYTNLV